MDSIQKYVGLIKEIPLDCQSAVIRKVVWDKKIYERKEVIESGFFSKDNNAKNSKEYIAEISRNDIWNEKDIARKVVKILMWGYPEGGRGRNIENLLNCLDTIVKIYEEIHDRNLDKDDVESLLKRFKAIKGLGPSTWSKFLFFFNVSINSRKCLIFDEKIVASLNKRQFVEFEEKKWRQNNNNYFEYLVLLDCIAKEFNVPVEKIEGFLFYFNVNYKFV